MPRRPSVLVVSIALHAVVLVVIASADLWRPITDWPTPRTAIAFFDDTPRLVKLDDIPLPSHARHVATSSSGAGPLRPTEAAPATAPTTIATEIDRPESTLSSGGADQIERLLGPGGRVAPEPPVVVVPPAPTKTAPIRLHSGIKPPERVVYIAPAYPVVARATHVEGVVIIEATIDEHGNVTQTRVLRSIPLLDDPAVAAVRQWKFSPTLLNNVPVSIVMTVTVNFKLTP
jgi:periplasmic protein TonB